MLMKAVEKPNMLNLLLFTAAGYDATYVFSGSQICAFYYILCVVQPEC